MAGLYGHRWTSAHGDTDEDGTWTAGLSGLTPDDFARGLRECVKQGDDWPPSLPTFRKWCQQPGSSHPPITRALPEPESVLEQRRKTAKHWHTMWVVSGLKPAGILSAEVRAELEAEFGKGQYKPWGDPLIQKYCTAATHAIEAKRPLPSIADWCPA